MVCSYRRCRHGPGSGRIVIIVVYPPAATSQVLARVNMSANINVASGGALVALPMDLEDVNIGGLHSLTVNNTRLTIRIPGRYLIVGEARFTGNATGYIELALLKN